MVRVCDKHAGVGLAGFLTLNPLTIKYSGADSCPTVGSTSSQNSNDPLPQERQCSRASPGNAERYSPEEEPPLSRLRISRFGRISSRLLTAYGLRHRRVRQNQRSAKEIWNQLLYISQESGPFEVEHVFHAGGAGSRMPL